MCCDLAERILLDERGASLGAIARSRECAVDDVVVAGSVRNPSMATFDDFDRQSSFHEAELSQDDTAKKSSPQTKHERAKAVPW